MVFTHYILSACEIAFSAYKNRNRKADPYIERAFLKLDNQSYQLNHLLLRIPTTPRKFIFLRLEGTEYHISFIDNPAYKMGSVTITDRNVCIAFSKEAEAFQPLGFLGVDVNERNVAVSATDGWYHSFTELGEVVEIKEKYRELRVKIARF